MKHILLALALLVAPLISAVAADPLCVGDEVVFTQTTGAHYNAVILEIYDNNTAFVRFPNREYSDSVVSTSTLHHHIQWLGRFSVNDRVVFTQTNGAHYSAVILALYADTNTALVRFPNGEYSDSQVSLNTLTQAVQQYGRFRTGDNVIFTQTTGAHYNAKILEIYEDGMVKVSFPNREYSDSVVSYRTLSFTQHEMDGFVVNEDVVFTQTNGARYNAKILALYEDGTAQVTFPNGEYSVSVVKLSQLSHKIYCTGNEESCRRSRRR